MSEQHNHEDKVVNKKGGFKKPILVTVMILIIAVGATFTWLYTGSLTSVKKKVFQELPLPVALVERKFINSKELYQATNMAKSLLQEAGQSTNNIESQILEQLIQNKKLEIIAGHRNIGVTNQEIDDKYESVLNELKPEEKDFLTKLLKDDYGISVSTFKSEVIMQSLLQDKLSVWFNQQETLNKESYQKARELLNQLDTGADFEQISNKYNEDIGSQDFAGDSGFVEYKNLLPEFQTSIKDLSVNDKKLVASRYGLHIMKIIGIQSQEGSDSQEDKKYNIQQIFIAPGDLEAWLDSESKKLKSASLL